MSVLIAKLDDLFERLRNMVIKFSETFAIKILIALIEDTKLLPFTAIIETRRRRKL